MMSDNRSDYMVMDLHLNQEPLDPPVGSVLGVGSLLNELENDLETTHGRIEDRIRQLEAVTARARQRQRWRQSRNPPELSNYLIEPMVNMGSDSGVHYGEDSAVALESTVERGKSCKRDLSHLAKALEMDSDVKRPGSGGGSFYDCNICLNRAKDPILTCCGHLFCWACFYQLPYVDSTAKECPVCKGEVTETNITPIYGNGNDTRMSELESGLKVPPRPRAHRIESVRQQRVNRGISHIPVAEALRRIRIGIGALGEHPWQQDTGNVSLSSNTSSQVLWDSGAGGSRRLQRTDSQFLPVDVMDPLSSNAAVIESERRTMDFTFEVHSTVPIPSSSRMADVSASVVHLENLTSDTASEISLTVPRRSSSSRRRGGVSRVLDVDNGVSREPRRRRLR